ncbi:Indoleamine 2,3-dioxygenase [Coprinopsis sp. MPI-PUGE-AT-0042]|nr:Indoleamine 2,3-dioxygenase [Coprinopsis sp. MPI-PUGE-AT-0042]
MVFSLLPSPPHFFTHFVQLAVTVLYSRLQFRRQVLAKRHSPYSYDIDQQTGFFPSQPLPYLPTPFAHWEQALRDANGNISLGEDDSEEALDKRPYGSTWRARIEAWPVLSTESLHSDLRQAQRAHLVLAWLVSFYVHSIPPANVGEGDRPEPLRVPKSLAVPLMQVSRHLGLAPVLTFADTVLWNWELIHADQPLSPNNIRFVNTFSGTDDEKNFYYASALAEMRGGRDPSLPNTSDLAAMSKVSRDLNHLASVVDDITEIIGSVRSACDPHIFYWDIRPWFEGSDADGPDGPGWVYEGVEEKTNLDLSGPSAGQSSIIHALDVFLNIDHKLQERRYPAPSPQNKRADHGFMERMRRYMPGRHREFLEALATSRSIRQLASSTPVIRDAYDAAVAALKRLRDSHIRVACLYVVSMSNSSPAYKSGCPAAAMIEKLRANRLAGKGPVRGTGGNELSLLLKAGRDATRRAMLKQ